MNTVHEATHGAVRASAPRGADVRGTVETGDRLTTGTADRQEAAC